jgi:acetoin utilization protein AcuA
MDRPQKALVRIATWHPQAERSARIASDFGAIVRGERLRAVLCGVSDVGGIVVGAFAGDELRGYATLVPSSALARERWENLPDTFELGSFEVVRSSRRQGIGTELLGRLHATVPIDNLLLFARGLVSHWDLAFSPLPPIGYRRLLLRMLDRVGFQRWETDDPEVNEHPLNFLAVRTGLSAPVSSLVAFADCSSRGGDMWS